jgi:hypothetical protein
VASAIDRVKNPTPKDKKILEHPNLRAGEMATGVRSYVSIVGAEWTATAAHSADLP